MLSNKPHILQLVALLRAHGMTDVVVCPGSRNAPIVHTLSACGHFRLHAITDERSAAFFALGTALATGRPVAVCVTSGSALLNVHPAVAEAFYQHVPLVVISADRPAAWIGQMDGQTLPQQDVFGPLSRRSVQVPEALTPTDEWHANRLINEALLCATEGEGGPVHLNVPISEPFYEFPVERLPEVRVIRRLPIDDIEAVHRLLAQCPKRWLLIGQRREALPEALFEALSGHFLIVAEHLSNCTGSSLVQRLTDEWAAQTEERPDLVITVGGHIIGKQLKALLRSHRPLQHWHVSAQGEVADTFCCLSHLIEADDVRFLSLLAQAASGLDDAPKAGLPSPAKADESDSARAMRALVSSLPSETPVTLHLANSTTVRNAQLMDLPQHVLVRCNRGVNGIEGSLSTAVGHAVAQPERLNVVVIGDLSFLYDNNALWHASLPSNLRIVLINNGGGEIFQRLPVPDSAESRTCICGLHTDEVAHLCAHYGISHRAAHSAEELTTLLPDFLCAESAGLLEVLI